MQHRITRIMSILFAGVLLAHCGSADHQSEVNSTAKKPAAGAGLDSSTSRQVDYEDHKVLRNGCYAVDPAICQIEKLIASKTNRLRGTLPALKYGGQIAWTARQWSKEQYLNQELSHRGFPEARTRAFLNEFMVRTIRFSGENVARSTEISPNASAEAIADFFVRTWWNSPTHKENMLGNHEYVGIGLHYRDGVWTATQLFGRGI